MSRAAAPGRFGCGVLFAPRTQRRLYPVDDRRSYSTLIGLIFRAWVPRCTCTPRACQIVALLFFEDLGDSCSTLLLPVFPVDALVERAILRRTHEGISSPVLNMRFQQPTPWASDDFLVASTYNGCGSSLLSGPCPCSESSCNTEVANVIFGQLLPWLLPFMFK